MEVLFSPFVKHRLAELSTDLRGEVDSNDAALSGDPGLQRGKPLPKPRARMDTYRVSRNVFNFAASTVNAPLQVCNVREVEFVLVLLNTFQWFEQDL